MDRLGGELGMGRRQRHGALCWRHGICTHEMHIRSFSLIRHFVVEVVVKGFHVGKNAGEVFLGLEESLEFVVKIFQPAMK
jgi:hypothetical protein